LHYTGIQGPYIGHLGNQICNGHGITATPGLFAHALQLFYQWVQDEIASVLWKCEGKDGKNGKNI
jgi:hypothetical protein